jgi:FtsZ-binding cell division protein ZapB
MIQTSGGKLFSPGGFFFDNDEMGITKQYDETTGEASMIIGNGAMTIGSDGIVKISDKELAGETETIDFKNKTQIAQNSSTVITLAKDANNNTWSYNNTIFVASASSNQFSSFISFINPTFNGWYGGSYDINTGEPNDIGYTDIDSTYKGTWIKLKSYKNFVLTEYKFIAQFASSLPLNFRIYTSIDETNWNLVAEVTNATVTDELFSGLARKVVVGNITDYKVANTIVLIVNKVQNHTESQTLNISFIDYKGYFNGVDLNGSLTTPHLETSGNIIGGGDLITQRDFYNSGTSYLGNTISIGGKGTININSDDVILTTNYTGGKLKLGVPGNNDSIVIDNGNVGIGTTDPTEKLVVVGNFKHSGYYVKGAVKYADIYVVGIGHNFVSETRLYLNGTRVYNGSSRGLTLTIISSHLEVVSTTIYDTYGSDTVRSDLATAMASIGRNQIGILSSFDAWEGNNASLKSVALRLGLTKMGTMMKTNAIRRRPYCAVFYGAESGIQSRDVIERMETTSSDGNRASISCRISTDGTAVAIHGATSVNALYASDADFGTNPVVVVNEEGKVGIGTTSPSRLLTVNGGSTNGNLAQFTSSANETAMEILNTNGAENIRVKQYLSNTFRTFGYYFTGDDFPSHVALRFNLGTNISDDVVAICESGGAVGIGTLNPAGESFVETKLFVNGGDITTTKRFVFYYNWALRAVNGGRFGFWYGNIQTNTSGTHVADITRNGTFSTISDDRLKTEEVYIENALETIGQLKPQTYLKKIKDITYHPETGEEIPEEKVYEAGLIAQEVYYDCPVLRHIVGIPEDANVNPSSPPPGYGNSDPTIDPDYSEWGTGTASVDYIQIIPYLIKAIQELKEKNDTLQERIDSLHEKNDSLHEKNDSLQELNNDLTTEIYHLNTETIPGILSRLDALENA